MKSWKLALGLAAGCAACCAVPLMGGAALVSVAAALQACAAELLPAAVVVLVLAALWFWRRSRAARRAPCGCNTVCTHGEGGACQ